MNNKNFTLSPLLNAVKNQLDQPQFTIALKPRASSIIQFNNVNDSGEISFGNVTSEYCIPHRPYRPYKFKVVPSNNTFWEMPIETSQVGTLKVTYPQIVWPIFNTESLWMPIYMYDEINHLVIVKKEKSGIFTVDCDKVNLLPEVRLERNDVSIYIAGKDYVKKVNLSLKEIIVFFIIILD